MNKNRKIIIPVILATITLGICFYYLPHWAVYNMKKAAENKDAEALSSYVDFPALKESLKANFNTMMASEVSNSMGDNPFAAFGVALATAFINPIIDNLVTPESLAMLMKGEKPKFNNTQSKSNVESSPQGGETRTSMRYDNLNRFIVSFKNKESQEEQVKLIFKRDGIISWKLCALRFPAGIEKKTASFESDPTKSEILSKKGKGDDTKLLEPEQETLVPVLTNKSFQKSEVSQGLYEDTVWFDITWDTSRIEKPIRAVKGDLIICDIFGEPKLHLRWTINEPLTAGENYQETGVGFEYNQFINSHKWFMGTDFKDMTFKFKIDDIIYQDGTRENRSS